MVEQQPIDLITLKTNLFEYVRLQLGHQIIDLELDPAHLEFGSLPKRVKQVMLYHQQGLELGQRLNVY